MKIAQYHGPHGKKDHVTFRKGPDPDLPLQVWDRVYVTTLFSFEYKKIAEIIDFALQAVHGHTQRVFVGGIAASLMHERFLAEPSRPSRSRPQPSRPSDHLRKPAQPFAACNPR